MLHQKAFLRTFSFLTFFVLLPFLSSSQDKDLERDARTLVNLLDYIGQDYVRAVEDGSVINEFEYKEMEEFVDRVRDRSRSIDSVLEERDSEPIGQIARIDSLDSLIARKASHDRIFQLCTSLKKKVLERGFFKIAPSEEPDLSRGGELFAQKCATCHGEDGRGDGPQVHENMEPLPSDLQEASYMKKVAPLKVFNTSRLGLDGTSMRAFDELSDDELWDLAFYVTALRYQDVHPDTAKLTYESLEDPPSLEERSLSSDEDLLEEELPSGMDSSRFLAAVRLHQESEKKGDAGQEALSLARDTIRAALEAYREGRKSEAREKAIDAYLQGVEPVEKRLENKSAALVDSLEATMFAVREGIKKGLSTDELSKRVEEAEAVLDKSAMALGGESSGYWAIFLITLSIILREGLEAFLIIIAILSVLRSLNVRKAAKWVHAGWLLALFIGIVSWFFADLLLDQLGMKNIEVMEGIGALTAVLILLFVGFWLHSRSEMSKWKELVEGRIHKLSNEGNMFGLGLLSFIVVFREAFESVIFLSAIRIGASEGAAAAIPMAAVLSLIAVLILAYIALHYAQRLPIRQLFRVSSVMLGLLAFVLMGKGIHAIQESGAISMTTFPIDLKMSFLGVYPTYETFIAQLFLIVLCVFLWFQGNKPLQRTEG